MPDTIEPQDELYPGPSRKERILGNAIVIGIFVIPSAVTGVAIYFGVKNTKIQFETAKLNLEAARLGK